MLQFSFPRCLRDGLRDENLMKRTSRTSSAAGHQTTEHSLGTFRRSGLYIACICKGKWATIANMSHFCHHLEALFSADRRQFLRVYICFAAFFKICNICALLHHSRQQKKIGSKISCFCEVTNIWQQLQTSANFSYLLNFENSAISFFCRSKKCLYMHI